jgi:hypothetical protein
LADDDDAQIFTRSPNSLLASITAIECFAAPIMTTEGIAKFSRRLDHGGGQSDIEKSLQ